MTLGEFCGFLADHPLILAGYFTLVLVRVPEPVYGEEGKGVLNFADIVCRIPNGWLA